jgi:hypothetical protein
MQPKDILTRWMNLEEGTGLAKAKLASRYLSIASFTICIAIALMGGYFELPWWVLVVPAVVVGWLIAERNALNTRVAQWPVYRKYIDWSRVRADLQSEPNYDAPL